MFPHARIILLMLLFGGVAACSLADFGYDMAPRIAVRYMDDYLQLDTRQEAMALDLFRARKQLHEKEELPQYAMLMAEIERRYAGELEVEDFNTVFDRINELWDIAVIRTVPAIAVILDDLDDDQLAALDESLADSEERYRERIEEHDRDERIEDRIEDIEEWTGDLDDEQKEFLRGRLAQMHDTRVAWLEWRIARNERLMELLLQRPGEQAIEDFLVSSWAGAENIPAELEQATEENRIAYRQLLLELDGRLSAEQHGEVTEKLAEYRETIWDLLSEEQRLALQERLAAGGQPDEGMMNRVESQ